jgi:bacterioferritin-associated ferredoxin
MYVCICKGITDKDIEKAVITHSNTKEVLRSLGVGSDCGQCVIEAIDLIRQNRNSPAMAKTDPRQIDTISK